MIDLAIVGGGPAGTAAAAQARRRGLGVTIWERDRFPRDKVCGEFVSSECLPLLGQEIPETLARGAVIRRAKFISPAGRSYELDLPQPGCGLSRRTLDEALWTAAANRGAETVEATAIRRVRKLNGLPARNERLLGWEIESANGEKRAARALLVACGRWWAIEGLPSPARRKQGDAGRWLGAKAHFIGVALHDAVEMYFFPGGYCGLAPIEQGLYNACCLVHRSLACDAKAGSPADFAAWLEKLAPHPALQERLRGAIQASRTVTTAPVRLARQSAHCQGALLAGDAAGFLDPFTGDGISQAIHGGQLAAELVAEASIDSLHQACAGRGPKKAGDRLVEQMACQYCRRLRRAVRPSYAVAGLVRLLVRAPLSVQCAAASTVPWLGPRLLAATRWRI